MAVRYEAEYIATQKLTFKVGFCACSWNATSASEVQAHLGLQMMIEEDPCL